MPSIISDKLNIHRHKHTTPHVILLKQKNTHKLKKGSQKNKRKRKKKAVIFPAHKPALKMIYSLSLRGSQRDSSYLERSSV